MPCGEPEKGRVLLGIAREALEEALELAPASEPPAADWLQERKASFVTLHHGGGLRGCIGSIRAHRPLAEDVRRNALAAAFEDPRFPPLRAEEMDDVSITVSVLSPLERLEFAGEESLLEQLRPGRDGLVLEAGARRGTFLPEVWKTLPQPREFLRQLKRKAGMPAGFWSQEICAWRYSVESWQEG